MRLLLAFLFSFNCLAIDIVPIKKGEPSPGEGFFVSIEEMKKFRQINEEKKLLEQKVLTFKDLSIVNDQRIEVYQKQSNYYQEQYLKQQTKTMWSGIGGFILGAAATSLAAYGTVRLLK
jgi:hypothetical protein